MMKKHIYTSVFSALLISTSAFATNPMAWSGQIKEKPRFWDSWSINLNGGLTSYFGDYSIYDHSYIKKLDYESSTAFGGILTKYFNHYLGVSGQLLYGNLKGGSEGQTSFKSSLLEYNLQLKIDLVRLISNRDDTRFGVETYAGLGQFFFKTTEYSRTEGDSKPIVHNTGIPQFVYFFGGGVYCKITDNFGITSDLSVHLANNDKIDNLVKNNDFDYYSYVSVGITYYIDKIFNSKPKRKIGMAHSSGSRFRY